MKTNSPTSKGKKLFPVMYEFLKDKLNLAHITLISLIIIALCKAQTVNFRKLAINIEGEAKVDSYLRRIQRFIASCVFPQALVTAFIFALLPKKTDLKLVIDRTNWKLGEQNINIFMVGVACEGIAIPLMFCLLNKKGNSNMQERITLISSCLGIIGKENIDCIIADREFVGDKWIAFLNENKLRYFIRIRKNFNVLLVGKNKVVKAFWLFNNLKINELKHCQKIVSINGQLCYISGCKMLNEHNKPDFLIVISYNKPEQSADYYAQRWQIETLFKGLKTSGFNMEKTHLTELDRIEKLLSLVMIAFLWCYLVGDFLAKNIKVIKNKTHGRREISVFKYGLNYIAAFLLNPLRNTEFNIFQILSCT